ncbi:hypothetical protein MAPG_03775 [Magnaporthiopsis poae ATCC 64411]|uniref:Uncharacterized protein n=1 Tax=Magnaporthiopsis poae (strain ATCC 64411 / 73-15) TaxID=644358 RepID=A0A0C4DUX8_MAGP6|nr:hypothetical protein MAPG_03775 [Magnaporthiopsis poae ATCC 64411]
MPSQRSTTAQVGSATSHTSIPASHAAAGPKTKAEVEGWIGANVLYQAAQTDGDGNGRVVYHQNKAAELLAQLSVRLGPQNLSTPPPRARE